MLVKDKQSSSVLRLNFLPLKSQEFSFYVYRKACIAPDEQRPEEDLYRYSFAVQADSEERQDYWTSFAQKEGFEEYHCIAETNRRLSIRYLCYLIAQNVQITLPASEFDLEDVRFRQGLDIITKIHAKGTERIWIEPCYLAPVCKFGFLVDFHFRKDEHVHFDREVQRLSLSLDRQGNSNKDFYADKFGKIQAFLKNFGTKVFSDTFVRGTLAVNIVMEAVEGNRLDSRQFVFASNHEYPVSFTGLDRFGPLTALSKPVRFALIYATPDRPLVNELASALIGKSKEVPFKGLYQTFRTQVDGSTNFAVPQLMPQDIPDIVERVKLEQQARPDTTILPLGIITNSNPGLYRALKYNLLKAGFAVQVVSTEKIRDRATFKWAVADIALQIFAKAGGEPWRVVPTTHRCVIFGIGQAHDHNADGSIRRFFSYLVCTDTTGLYRKSDVLGASEDETTYLSQLQQKITEVMRTELASGYTRCVLHVPFKVKHRELKAIEEAIEHLKQEASSEYTQFVVMRINSDSKYFGYADTNSLIPYESTFVRVSNSPKTYLVWFEGLQPDNPVVRKRPSGPIQIEFHWPQHELKEAEERQYLQDVLNLAGCNWRGFNAKHLPISIFYCQLIAQRLKLFGDPAIQLNTISIPWFL